MAFHTGEFHLYVLLGDPASEPLWHWKKWQQLTPDLDAFFHVARGPASIHSTQFLPNFGGTVKFGKIAWKEKDQQKWTHGSPSNLDSSPNWNFVSAELWVPARAQCEREASAPDIFMSIASESAVGTAASFQPVVLLAVVSELARCQNALVAIVIDRLWELMNPKLVAHQRRPWGRSALGGAGFTNSIQDLHVSGLFKPGRRQERAVGLDLLAGEWEPVHAPVRSPPFPSRQLG